MKPETRDDGERAAANRLPADESRGHLMMQIARMSCQHRGGDETAAALYRPDLCGPAPMRAGDPRGGGAGKQIVTLGALQAGVFNILVTGEATATFLLEHAHDR